MVFADAGGEQAVRKLDAQLLPLLLFAVHLQGFPAPAVDEGQLLCGEERLIIDDVHDGFAVEGEQFVPGQKAQLRAQAPLRHALDDVSHFDLRHTIFQFLLSDNLPVLSIPRGVSPLHFRGKCAKLPRKKGGNGI